MVDRCDIPYSQEGLLVNFMTFHFRLMRRCIYDRVGGVNASFTGSAYDYDLCLRLSEVAQVAQVKQPLYFYPIIPKASLLLKNRTNPLV